MAASALVPLLVSLAACEAPPVAWQEERSGAPLDGPASADGAARLTLDAGGKVALVPPSPLGLPEDAPEARRCPASVRFAAGMRGERFAAWWAVRPDSSALLLVAYSSDSGRTWAAPSPVDTLDRGVRGCARPSPALAADLLNGYVHVAYFLDAPEGPGLFYSHLMDPRARFEPPSVIVYGERPVAASVASAGDTVAVAYEDPNRPRPQIELALSRTAGHLFEERHIDVSGDDVPARAPRVAVGAGRVAVMWTEGTNDGDAPGGRVVVRVGRLR